MNNNKAYNVAGSKVKRIMLKVNRIMLGEFEFIVQAYAPGYANLCPIFTKEQEKKYSYLCWGIGSIRFEKKLIDTIISTNSKENELYRIIISSIDTEVMWERLRLLFHA